MTAERQDAVRDEAIGWHLRLADGSAEDWETFVVWLEADPAHGAAYDAVEAAVDEAAPAIEVNACPAPLAANDDDPAPRARWWLGGAAVAASIALAVLFVPSLVQRADPYEVASAPGETRIVRLPSGDIVTLNGGSRLILDHKSARYAELDQGEALFSVRHDPQAPFVVRVGDERIQDVGTVFNVARNQGGVRVAVAEGSVLYNPDREAVTLAAGETLTDPGGDGTIVRGTVDRAAVGSWREGRLSYTAAALPTVAADLARSIGEPVTVDPALAGRRFTGTIRIDRDRARLFADLSVLLNVRVAHGDGGWTLAASGREAR